MVRRLLATLMVTLMAWPTAPVRADAPTTVEALLALPPSPGVELLLLPHAADPRVSQRWRDALTDADPDRRAAAARMIGIAGMRSAVARVAAALPKESDPIVRAELARALIVIGSETTDRVVLKQLTQVPPSVALAASHTLATLRPVSVVTFLAEGGVLADDRVAASAIAGAVFGRVLRVAPEQATRLETSAATLASSSFQGLLHVTHSTSHRVPASVVVAGLRMDAHTAGEVLAYLPFVYGHPRSAADDEPLQTAYAAWRREAPGAATTPTHALLLALADRWLRVSPAADLPLDTVDEALLGALQLPASAYAVLTRDERRALVARLGWTGDDANALTGADFMQKQREWEWESRNLGADLLADLPAAVVADAARLTGCEGKAFETDRALTATYRPDGRPQSITLGGTPLEPACDRLVTLLTRASYGIPTVPGDLPGRRLLRILPDFVACLSDRDGDARQQVPAPGAGPHTPPRRVKDQLPAYPLAVKKAGIQGVVIVDADVTRSGCVSGATVSRSIPLLDLPALQAAVSWRYTPARRDDIAVPTTVRELINFSAER